LAGATLITYPGMVCRTLVTIVIRENPQGPGCAWEHHQRRAPGRRYWRVSADNACHQRIRC